ncbi:hypothetical protein CGLO_02776 [Colletotrichum gloeosporioides Cg-14]|uniref:Uncharacterized protein n=1 Tax=Colletotrichum gloeosporioides (strain Cg-14) TaxID=1237896 RepID=T0KY50_COLGC|nr:hypothetical protein CGLO_02776 [Colletotrichum gloeosporioides Cg-14]
MPRSHFLVAALYAALVHTATGATLCRVQFEDSVGGSSFGGCSQAPGGGGVLISEQRRVSYEVGSSCELTITNAPEGVTGTAFIVESCKLGDIRHIWCLVDNKVNQQAIEKLTFAVVTKDVDTIGQFKQMSDTLNERKSGLLVELAELGRAINTVDVDELRGYRSLAFSHSTRDAEELRALKRLAGRHSAFDA